MSIIVFIFGIVLLIVSSYNMLFEDNVKISTYIPFISGLGFMLLIFFSAPIKEIRQAVVDLATANAAFIAYIHRVLESSHTYTYFLLREKLQFEELEKSNEIIKNAMNDTVEALDRKANNSSERTILKTLNRLYKHNKNTIDKSVQ